MNLRIEFLLLYFGREANESANESKLLDSLDRIESESFAIKSLPRRISRISRKKEVKEMEYPKEINVLSNFLSNFFYFSLSWVLYFFIKKKSNHVNAMSMKDF